MPIGTTAALITAGLMAGGSAGASIYGAKKGAGAAKDAAAAQVAASNYAADLQHQSSDEALQFQKDVWNQQQETMKPWLEAGQGALGQLAEGMRPGGNLAKTFDLTFDGEKYAFDPSKVQMDPGFDFRLKEGQKAIERGAAARGSALGGAAMKALTRYGQDYSSEEYSKAYGRALGENQLGYNRALGEFQQKQDLGNQAFNRLAALAGVGQTAAGSLNSSGQAFASAAAQNALTTGANLGNIAMNAGNAQASGMVGAANAWNAGLTGAVNGGMNAAILWKLLQGGGGAASPFTGWGGGAAGLP